MMTGMMEVMFPIVFFIIFLFTIGMMLFMLVQGIRTWNKNNHSPRLSVSAKVIAKRQNTSYNSEPLAGDASGAHGYRTTTSTVYYVTFQFESGDRMEFHIPSSEYGLLLEGDEGTLTFQGTRYLGFQR